MPPCVISTLSLLEHRKRYNEIRYTGLQEVTEALDVVSKVLCDAVVQPYATLEFSDRRHQILEYQHGR